MLHAQWLSSPLGDLVAVADASAVRMLGFARREDEGAPLAALAKRLGAPVEAGGNAVTAELARELDAYFAGRSAAFSVPLRPAGSDFELAVWARLQQVREGETCSYGDIAREVGGIETSRAVGRANNANPIVILIPCHRCIGADGSLTGYGGGLWRKKWLLRHEGKMRPLGLFAL